MDNDPLFDGLLEVTSTYLDQIERQEKKITELRAEVLALKDEVSYLHKELEQVLDDAQYINDALT